MRARSRQPDASLSRRVGLNTVSQIAARLYSSALAFAITALLLPRRLDVADFGLFAFYLTLYQLLQNVLDFGAGTIVIREASRDRERAGRLIGLLIGIKARLALAAIVALLGVAWLFDGLSLRTALLVLASLHLLAHAPSAAGAIFSVDMAFARANLASALGQTTWLAGTLLLLLAGVLEPSVYLMAFGLGAAAGGLLTWAWARRRVAIRLDGTAAERAALWTEAWPAGVSMTMASVYFYIDAVMLRPMLGEVAVAHYSVAYRLMGFVLMVPVLFSQVVFPVFSRLWPAGGLDPFFQRTTALLAGFGLLFPPLIWLLRRDLMALVYPPDYAAGADSLGILSLAIPIVFAAYPHVLTLLSAGQQRLMMGISTAGAVLNVALNLWWVPQLGIEGAAWATVATEAFVLGSAAFAVHRRAGLAFRPLALARPLLCGALATLALWALLRGLDAQAVALRCAAGIGLGAAAALCAGLLPLRLEVPEPVAAGGP
jgi:O-antigen/teichoic acid export membrane protein